MILNPRFVFFRPFLVWSRVCRGSRDCLCRMACSNTPGGGADRSRPCLQDRAGAAVHPGVFGAAARKGSLPGQGHGSSPRVRGTSLREQTIWERPGASPPVRGSAGVIMIIDENAGCIAARAGRRGDSDRSSDSASPHPRDCGRGLGSHSIRWCVAAVGPRVCGAGSGLPDSSASFPGSAVAPLGCGVSARQCQVAFAHGPDDLRA